MKGVQHLYYALGQLAYSVAMADGKFHRAEKDRFHQLMVEEAGHDVDFDYGDIIFKILETETMPLEIAYHWAIKEIETNKQYFTPELKDKFTYILERVGQAFPPLVKREVELIDRFRNDTAGF